MIKKIGRFFRTLRRLSLRQLLFRVVRIIKFRLIYPIFGPVLFSVPSLKDSPIQEISKSFQQLPELLIPGLQAVEEIETRIALADEIFLGNIKLLNQSTQLPDKIDWSFSPQDDPLWNYTLHYFEWADPLLLVYAKTKEKKYYEKWVELVEGWIQNNPPGKGLSWHPYPVSRRIITWVKACALLNQITEEELPKQIISSILQQARFLAKNFEYDLQNNHLVSNAAALAMVGSLFSGWDFSKRWRDQGYGVLWKQIIHQVNEEGFHHERSTSYQKIVLADAAETVAFADRCGYPVPIQVRNRLRMMEEALNSIAKPDGKYPLINDSVDGYPRDNYSLFTNPSEVNVSEESNVYPGAGFVIIRYGEGRSMESLFFDCGPMGPESNPGHGHAGALGFELYAMERPLIIDPGVYSYHQQPWRNYFRSTSSHNTLVVDGLDQSEIWSSFRVGKMAAVKLLEWDVSGREQFALAQHDGYQRLPSPVTHSRKVIYQKSRHWKVIDKVEGSGPHIYEIYYHFSPEAKVYPGNGNEFLVDFGEEWRLKILFECSLECEGFIDKGWVSESWNQKQEAPVLCFRSEGYPSARWEFDLRIE